MQAAGSRPALFKYKYNESHAVRWRLCDLTFLLCLLLFIVSELLQYTLEMKDVYAPHQQVRFTIHLPVSKQFKDHSCWLALPFRKCISMELPDHVWHLPNPVSHSEARRWATVSVRCPLHKSQPHYIILWFICTIGRRRMRLRHAANLLSFCYEQNFVVLTHQI